MDETVHPSRRRFLTGRFDLAIKEPVDEAVAPKVAWIDDSCLAYHGIDCQLCRDICEVGAIRFRPRRGGPYQPSLRTDLCTGCGDCIPVCPSKAIALIAAAAPAEGPLHG